MHPIDLSTLLERLEAERARARRPVLATDADGTLWSGDVGVDTFEALLDKGAVRPEALSSLRTLAHAHGLTAGDDPTAIARQLYEAFQNGAFPEDRCYELMAWAFAGFTPAQARDFTRSALDAARLESRLHPELTAVLAWARERAVRIVVVSASPRFVVECGVERLGIPGVDVVGTTPALDAGLIAPRLAEPMPYGPRKVVCLRERAPGAQVIAAFGDSGFDLPMLDSAELPIAVRPKTSLRRAATGSSRVLELLADPAPLRTEPAAPVPD